jgi:hypothetical protein
LPILDIYRKYYGWRVMGYILLTFYVTMAAAGYSNPLMLHSCKVVAGSAVPLSFNRVVVLTAMAPALWFSCLPYAEAASVMGWEHIPRSCKNCSAVTELDQTPLFSRASSSFVSSRERAEKTRKQFGGREL